MSILSFVEPLESAIPAAENALAMAALTLRTIGGLGVMAAMFLLFRPILTGVWHALLLSVKPRMTPLQRMTLKQHQATRHTVKTNGDVSSKENSIT